MAQIFLSYSRTDFDAARAIANALSQDGHSVWWDKHISGGAKFAAEIEQALADAQIVIVLWSKEAVSSAWVLDEAAEGRDTGRLVPVALDGCKPPLGFRQFQTVSAAGGPEAALHDIFEAIADRCGEHSRGPAKARRPSSNPRATASHCAAAQHLADNGKLVEAWREIEAALDIDADCAIANSEAGWLLYVQGRAVEAIPFYERAAAEAKAAHESPAMLISCYRAGGDPVAMMRAAAIAVARAEQSIAASSNNGAAFASGAKGLAALGHVERAKKWVRKALNVDPGNLPMRYALASTLARYLDDEEAAIDVLEPFVEAASKRIHLLLLECDPDFMQLRQSSVFKALVGRARKRVEALESMG